jgi:putative membrane protein
MVWRLRAWIVWQADRASGREMMKKGMRVVMLGMAGALCFGGVRAKAADTASQDKKFVMEAGEGSVGEIEMGKLALKNSTNKEVRAFAQKMVHDHSMLIADLKPFADKMGVPAPTVDKVDGTMKDEYKRLEGKKGEEFDKDYIQTMTDDHHKDLEDFVKERDTTANPALKATVAKGAEVVKHHLVMVEVIAHKMNLSVPNKP